MKNHILSFIFLCLTVSMFGQKDSLQLGDHYADDQLYLLVSYNQFINQPDNLSSSGFSYGLSTGFIKDVILNKQGTVSVGLGVGYSYDSYNHDLLVSELAGNYTFSDANTVSSNKLYTHSIELPLELRWRNSNAQKYSFWRVYGGVKASYNLSNRFVYSNATGSQSISDLNNFNKWQYGLTLSIGYDAFTAHMYYGLTPILKDANLNGADITSKILKIGIVFYLL